MVDNMSYLRGINMKKIEGISIASFGYIYLLNYMVFEYFKSGSWSYIIKSLMDQTEVFFNLVIFIFPVVTSILGYMYYRNSVLDEQLKKKYNELKITKEKQDKTYEELQVTYNELEKAYRELKHVDGFKRNVISNVSHELKTPITLAKGYIEFALDKEGKGDVREFLKTSRKALIRLLEVVDNLVTFAELNRLRSVRPLRQVEIKKILENCIEIKRQHALDKDISVHLIFNEPIPRVKAKKKELHRIFSNLLDNSVKFNNHGGNIYVRVKSLKNNVVIEFEDTGIGMNKEVLNEIFTPFFQAEMDITRHYPGVGMGLTLVKKLVELNGGKLEVASIPGKGTKFSVVIPATD